MNFNDIENILVNNDGQFDEFIKLLTNTDPTDRKRFYEVIANNRGIELSLAKDVFLKDKLSFYVKNKLQSALRSAQLGASNKEILDQISFLKKLSPIFKSHDINTRDSFVSSIEPDISQLEVSLLTTKHLLNEQEVLSFKDNLKQALITKQSEAKTVKEYRNKIISHPMLKCLNSHKDSKALIENIENGVLELGVYRDLILNVLNAGLNLNKESHQRLLFFIINEDIKHNGLFNIMKNPEYRPNGLKELLNNIANGTNIYEFQIASLANDVSVNFTSYGQYKNGEIKELPSSSKSLMDSMFFYPPLNVATHLHTAQNSGTNQNGQQANTSLVMKEAGFEAIGVTIAEKSIVDKIDNQNSYLNSYKDNINLNIKEIVWMSTLQINADILTSLSSERGLNLESLNNFANTLFLIEKAPYLSLSLELAKNKSEKNDLENITEDKDFLFSIISKNKDFIKDVISDSVSENSKCFQHWGSPIVKTIQSYLKLEKRNSLKILNNEDIELVKFILDGNFLNTEIKATSANILDDIDERNIEGKTEISLSKNNSLFEWRDIDFVPTKDHLTAIKNVEEDVVGYFIENEFNTNNYTQEQKNDLMVALRKRVALEWGEKYNRKDMQPERLMKLFDKIDSGENVYTSESFVTNYYSDEERIFAKIVNNAHKDRENVALNLLAIAANIRGVTIGCFGSSVMQNKVKIKFNS